MRKILIIIAIFGQTAVAEGWRCKSPDDVVCQDALLNKIEDAFGQQFNPSISVHVENRSHFNCEYSSSDIQHSPGPLFPFRFEAHTPTASFNVLSADLYLATNLATVVFDVQVSSSLSVQAPWQITEGITPLVVNEKLVLNLTPQPGDYHQGVQKIGEILSDAWSGDGAIYNTNFTYSVVYPRMGMTPSCGAAVTENYNRDFLRQTFARVAREKFLNAINVATQ